MDKDEKKEYFLSVYRHSLAHIMAKAVMEIFGKENVQIAIGPQIEDGAYYDFVLPRNLGPDDFETIENKMREILKRKEDWTRKEVSRQEALDLFKDQKFKTELIEELPEFIHRQRPLFEQFEGIVHRDQKCNIVRILIFSRGIHSLVYSSSFFTATKPN